MPAVFDPKQIVQARTKDSVRIVATLIHEEVRKYPDEKHVSRAEAGMDTSPAQWRLIFAKIKAGEIPYVRTEALRSSWTLTYFNGGQSAEIRSAASGIQYVMGDQQSPQMRLIGWRTVRIILKDLARKIQAALDEQVRRT